MRKAYLTVALFVLISTATHAQYVELPTADLYDTNTMMMSIEAMRTAAAIDNRMYEWLLPILNDLYSRYNSGDYSSCVNEVNSVFNNVTFYKRQYYMYAPLYYIRGMSYIQLGKENEGIRNLVEAQNAQWKDATSVLQSYFSQYCDKAYTCLVNKDYHGCLNQVTKALSTTYYNYSIYEFAGAAYEGFNSFDAAKKYYKLAQKAGSPNARELLKRLSVHKKEYNKK